MPTDPRSSLRETLRGCRDGSPESTDAAFAQIYSTLREMAAAFMRDERENHTLQPTALVHEAYLRLAGDENLEAEDRSRFLGIAAGAMRRALVDHARTKRARKRGSDWRRVTLDENLAGAADRTADILALDAALGRLEARHPRMCRVVELRFFAGLRGDEIAEVLGVSPRTVTEDWAVAKAWLGRELRAGDGS